MSDLRMTLTRTKLLQPDDADPNTTGLAALEAAGELFQVGEYTEGRAGAPTTGVMLMCEFANGQSCDIRPYFYDSTSGLFVSAGVEVGVTARVGFGFNGTRGPIRWWFQAMNRTDASDLLIYAAPRTA